MTQRRVASMLSLAAVGILVACLTGCQVGEPEAKDNEPPAEVVFDPHIEVTEATKTLEGADEAGLQLNLTAAYPAVEATGMDEQIAEDFAQAVSDNHLSQVDSQLQKYSDITLAECGDERLEKGSKGPCERASVLVVENAGVYEDYGTVVTRSGFILGTRDRNPQVHSVTMNLRTGETAALEEFLDLSDPEAQERAATALKAAENWAYCQRSPAEETLESYLATASAFGPTEEGVMLLWAPDPTATAQCQVDRIVVPWTAPEPVETGPVNGPATAEGIVGSWCPTPESPETACVSIALPTATYDDGTTMEIMAIGEEAGGFAFAGQGAPFGTYYPAGTAIVIPDYYTGADLPEQDRIWNGQTGTMLVRQ